MDEILNIVRTNFNDDFNIVKRGENSIVIEGKNHFYKICAINEPDQTYHFELLINATFAKEYRKLGLDWEIHSERINDHLFTIERREKLTVAKSSDYKIEDLQRRSSEIKARVEQKLELALSLAQIRQTGKFQNINSIVLARDSNEQLDDFAIYSDHIIQLGNSSWFLAPINNFNNWDRLQFAFVEPISLSYGNYYFADYNIFNENRESVSSIYDITQKWWLFPTSVGDIYHTSEYLRTELEQMLKTNSKILVTKEKLNVKDRSNFGIMKDECERLLPSKNPQ